VKVSVSDAEEVTQDILWIVYVMSKYLSGIRA